MDYRTLDATRIVEATLAPESGRVRVVGEASASYPRQAGLTHFRRTFTFEAPDRFVVSDDIASSDPHRVEWYLHSDDPIRGEPPAFRLGDDRAGLEVSLRLPPGSQTTTGPTWVMAPGAPGSIEKGSRDQRGYEIEVKTPPATAVAIEATMVVKRVGPASLPERSDSVVCQPPARAAATTA